MQRCSSTRDSVTSVWISGCDVRMSRRIVRISPYLRPPLVVRRLQQRVFGGVDARRRLGRHGGDREPLLLEAPQHADEGRHHHRVELLAAALF